MRRQSNGGVMGRNAPASAPGGGFGPGLPPPGRGPKATLEQIQRIEREREQRRNAAAERRAGRAAEERRNAADGVVGDVDFMRAIKAFRDEAAADARPHQEDQGEKVCIVVRKRPINNKEIRKNDYDIVTCLNPKAVVHNCKLRVDGITKFLDNQAFEFDHAFDEETDTSEVYHYLASPLVKFVCAGGRATCFAYGQTGSGKTHTMMGIQEMAVGELFEELDANPEVYGEDVDVGVSFFEIYGPKCQDLLNKRRRLNVREDGKGEVHVGGLEEFSVASAEELLELVARGNRARTTQATESNDTSSRSHAICQIALRRRGRLLGKLSLVDLAGSERGNDTKSHNRQLRTESAEINKSLLALKECIRGIASNSSHVPFRASKLTMVLRDSFVRPHARVAMITTVSPAASSADHTINSLRYADRAKEKNCGQFYEAASGLGPEKPPLTPGGGGAPSAEAGLRSFGDSTVDGPNSSMDGEYVTAAVTIPALTSPAHGSPHRPPHGLAWGDTPEKAPEKSSAPRTPSLLERARRERALRAAEEKGSGVDSEAKQSEAKNEWREAKDGAGAAKQSNKPLRRNLNGTPPPTSAAEPAVSQGKENRVGRRGDPTRGGGAGVGRRGPGDREKLVEGREGFTAVDSGSEDESLEETVDGPSPPEGGEVVDQRSEKDRSTQDHDADMLYLQRSVGSDQEVADLHKTVESLFEEEEALLNLHMNSIQENAELLTEEGRLLQAIQGDDVVDYDIDAYATRLQEILDRKAELIKVMQARLTNFRRQLADEEKASKRVLNMPQY